MVINGVMKFQTSNVISLEFKVIMQFSWESVITQPYSNQNLFDAAVMTT